MSKDEEIREVILAIVDMEEPIGIDKLDRMAYQQLLFNGFPPHKLGSHDVWNVMRRMLVGDEL